MRSGRRRALLLSLFWWIGALVLAAPAVAAAPPSVKVEPPAKPLAVPSGGTAELVLPIEIARGYHLYGENESGYIPIRLSTKKEGVRVAAKLPDAHVKELFGEKVPVHEGTLEARVAISVGPDHTPGAKLEVPLEVSYQACTDEFCENPAKLEVKVPVEVVAGVGAAAPGGEAPAAAATGTSAGSGTSAGAGTSAGTSGTPTATPTPTSGGDEATIWKILGALLAGLGVTLTPCVYPLIPVTVTYFQQQAKGSRARAVPLALAYGAGIVIMYAALGVITARVGVELGSVIYKGSWFFVALFVALALSMFGLFELQLPSSLTTRLQSGERSGAVGAFLLGLTLGLIAAPCTGPVAGGLMLLVAQEQDIAFGLQAFGAFGLGIALPFMALGTFSGALSSIPRAGAWMNSVKHVFGFILLAFAIYFVDVALGNERVAYVLFGLLFAAAGTLAAAGAGALLARRKRGAALARVAAALALLPVGVWFLLGPYVLEADSAVPPPQKVFEPKIAWRHDHDAGLAEAKREGKPAFIDFTARWCLPCRELDYTTFRDEAVIRESRRFVAIKLDFTDSDSEVAKLKLEKYRAPYAPFIAFYDSRGNYLEEKSFKGKPSTEEFLARLKEIR